MNSSAQEQHELPFCNLLNRFVEIKKPEIINLIIIGAFFCRIVTFLMFRNNIFPKQIAKNCCFWFFFFHFYGVATMRESEEKGGRKCFL